jgi:hypothetical protein
LRFSASTPPLIELRVVSLPPTISSIRLPRYSCGVMLRVAGVVRQHRDQVVARRRVDALVPQPVK